MNARDVKRGISIQKRKYSFAKIPYQHRGDLAHLLDWTLETWRAEQIQEEHKLLECLFHRFYFKL